MATVLETGRPELRPELTDDMLARAAQSAEHLELLRAVGAQSYMVLPLHARGRVLGAMVLLSTDPARRYGEGDLAAAEELAGACALAVDNARLYGEAREAERRKDEGLALLDAVFAMAPVGLGLLRHPAALRAGQPASWPRSTAARSTSTSAAASTRSSTGRWARRSRATSCGGDRDRRAPRRPGGGGRDGRGARPAPRLGCATTTRCSSTAEVVGVGAVVQEITERKRGTSAAPRSSPRPARCSTDRCDVEVTLRQTSEGSSCPSWPTGSPSIFLEVPTIPCAVRRVAHTDPDRGWRSAGSCARRFPRRSGR